MPANPKLVLIDGHALLYRAYHALPPTMITSQGEPTNAIYGFLNIFLKVVGDEQADHVIVCFDKGRTFRHDLYDEYKAHRAKMPDDLRSQVGRLEEVLHALGIPTYALEGYEADDLIGTLSRQATEAGLDTLIVTGDIDALQLVTDHVNVLTPGRRYSETVRYDPERVKERFGFAPAQLIEFKGLKGDPSDNIPGVPGVGDKTATKLVQTYGSLEKVYEHLDQVQKRYRSALEENRQQAFFSRDLATIRTDVPVELDAEGSVLGGYDREEVVRLFRELEFRTLLNRLSKLFGEDREAGEAPTRQLSLFGEQRSAAAVPASYTIVRDEAGLSSVVEALGQGPFAFDTETTSLNPMETGLVGLSVAVSDGRAWYIPVGHRTTAGTTAAEQLRWESVRQRLAVLSDPAVPKYAHHAKFDTLVLVQHGMDVRGVVFDTMIAAHLLGERSARLKDLAFRRLGVEMQTIVELLGKGASARTMDQVPIEQAGPYACADADMTFRLQALLAPRLAQQENVERLFREIEMPLVRVLRDMERAGIGLDVGFLSKMSAELSEGMEALEKQIHELAGHDFNVRSTQQLSEVLFDELGLPLTATRKLKSGAFSTASDVLEKLRGAHPIVEAVLDYRELAKLNSTYVEALPKLVNPQTGRVHTSFNQTATTTGRLSSSDPNLQNIPIRTELGRRVRYAFVADPGCVLLSADYSQVELRVLAHLSEDPGLLEAFALGEDIHASTAATLFDVPRDQVTAQQRRVAKTVNFGLMYGMSDFGLAQRLQINREDAAHFIETYFGRYANVRRYIEETLEHGREQGYVRTLLGRRRYIPELRSSNRNVRMAAEREAVNAPIQGTAADIIKIAMVRLYRALGEGDLRSRMLLQVHDELVLEVPHEEVGTVEPLVVEIMEGAYPLDAPLRVDVHTGPTWGDLK